MKAILIDPAEKSARYIESDLTLQELHQLIDAETLDFAHPFGPYETLAVADDGAARNLKAFRIDGYHWPIFGKAILFGRDSGGKDCSTRVPVDLLFGAINWEVTA